MDTSQLLARTSGAVCHAIASGDIVYIYTASGDLTDELLLLEIQSGLCMPEVLVQATRCRATLRAGALRLLVYRQRPQSYSSLSQEERGQHGYFRNTCPGSTGCCMPCSTTIWPLTMT